MNHNDRALAGLAWLAATMPTLVQQDCLKGDEITELAANGYDIRIQFVDHSTAARVAGRLALPVSRDLYIDEHGYAHQTWRSEIAGFEVTVSYCANVAPRRECMDEVTA